MLLGDGPLGRSLEARVFAGGILETVQTIVATTSDIAAFAASASDLGIAAAWAEDSGKLSVATWEPVPGWSLSGSTSLSLSEPPIHLAVARSDVGNFVIAFGDFGITHAVEFDGQAWSALTTFDGVAIGSLNALSDGRILLSAVDLDLDRLSAYVFDAGSGWSEPTLLDVPPYDIAVEVDGSGGAVLKAGQSTFAQFEGNEWSTPFAMTEEYSSTTTAFELREAGEGFGFRLCSRYQDDIAGEPCLFRFAAGEFEDAPEFIGESTDVFGATNYTGTALNDDGNGVVTWISPVDLSNPYDDIRIWAATR